MPQTSFSQTPSRRFRICMLLLKTMLIVSIGGVLAYVYVFAYTTHSKMLSTALLEQSISPSSVDRVALDSAEAIHAFKTERVDATYADPFAR